MNNGRRARFRIGWSLVALASCVTPDEPASENAVALSGSAEVHEIDLDHDGANDTHAVLAPCASDAGQLCLALVSTIAQVGTTEIPIGKKGAGPCESSARNGRTALRGAAEVKLIGDYDGDGLDEISVAYCKDQRPAIAVVSAGARKLVGRAVAPDGQKLAYIDFPACPLDASHGARKGERALRPFLAPSYADSDLVDPVVKTPLWGYMCIFDGKTTGDARCGDGFMSVSTVPFQHFFRENGGTLQDLDGDGCEDVNLIYHYAYLTISSRNGATIDLTRFALENFTSGRLYGTHRASTAPNGSKRSTIVGGDPIGNFKDENCNVTRFAAILESGPKHEGPRRVKFLKQYSFALNTFTNGAVTRYSDALDGCIHRYDDSRVVVAGEPFMIFDQAQQLFDPDRGTPVCTGRDDGTCLRNCVAQQEEVYRSGFDPGALERQAECQRTWQKAPTRWHTIVLRESDGANVPALTRRDQYMWGYTDAVVPGTTVFLFEPVKAKGPFDLELTEPKLIEAYTIENGQWKQLGTFPVPGRPQTERIFPTGEKGVGSNTRLSELILVPTNGKMGVALEAQKSVVVWNGTNFVLATP
jgi:hypothetical protein